MTSIIRDEISIVKRVEITDARFLAVFMGHVKWGAGILIRSYRRLL